MAPLCRQHIATFVAIILILIPRSVLAQSREDHVYIGGRVTSSARLDDRQGARSSQDGVVVLSAPSISLGDRDRLHLGLAYSYTGIEVDRSAVLGTEPRRWNLHAFNPSIAYSHVFGRRWVLSLAALPTLASDFRSAVSIDDGQINGLAMMTYLVGGNPDFRLSLAVLAQSRPLFTPVLPFLTLDYRNRFIDISVGLAGLRVLGRIDDRAAIGVFGTVGGGVYHVRSPEGEPRSARVDFVRLANVAIGPEVNVRIAGPVWLEARAGYNLLQSGKLTDDNLERIPGISLDSKGSFFGQVGIGVR